MKNKLVRYFSTLMAMLTLFMLSACGGQVTVTFDSQGGSSITSVVGKSGDTIDVEPVSSRAGYSFEGWLIDDEPVSFPFTLEKNATLVASWELETYQVTFHSDGGSTIESFTYTFEDDEIYLDDPIRAGYAFLGWFPNETLQGSALLSIPSESTGDKDFYASWDVIDYNINYHLNGGTLSNLATTQYTIDSSNILLLVPTKTGYSFDGWYDNEQFSGSKIEQIAQGSSGTKHYYAKWVATQFDVAFILYDGIGATNFSYTIEDAARTLPIPTRDGFTFGGWYLTNQFTGEAVTSIAAGSSGHRTFHAKWNAIVYTITYELNQGSFGGSYPQSFTAESAVDLVAPSRVGFSFLGWFDNEALAGSPVEVIAEGHVGSVHLYAKWEAATFDFSITYVLNSGSLTAGYPQGYFAGTEVILPIPTRLGAQFVGWFAASDLSGVSSALILTTDSGNKTFYAKWNLNSYSISYVLNGGTGAENRSYDVESGAITLAIPTRVGFTFDGWFTASDFAGSPVSTLAARSTGDRTFYAKWTAETTSYLINYQFLNGGTFTVIPKTAYTAADATYVLPIPVRTYYIFSGWKDNPSLTGATIVEIVSGSIGNRDLYAVWTPESYAITYNLNGGVGAATGQYSYKAPNLEFVDPTRETVLPVPTKSGFIFGGWYVDAALTDTNSSRPGSGAISTLVAGSNGAKTFYAKWISASVLSNTAKFEAENTNLIGKTGSGWSGSAAGSNMIVEDAGASAGKYVGWLTNEGSSVEFYVTSDRAVSNATLTVTVNIEMIRDQVVLKDVTLSNQNYTIMVNGQAFTFSQLVIGGDDPYNLPRTNIVISNVNLLAGVNTILLVNGKNTFWDGRQAGPGVDCIQITSTSQLSWIPVTYS